MVAEPERELRDMGASFESALERPLAASAPRTPELPDMGASLESVPTPQGETFLAPSTPDMLASLQSVPTPQAERPLATSRKVHKLQCHLCRAFRVVPDALYSALTCVLLRTIERGRNPEKRDSSRASQTRSFGFRPGVGGSRALARKRPKCLFLQCFAVFRAFLQPSRSVSRFWKSQPRGQ